MFHFFPLVFYFLIPVGSWLVRRARRKKFMAAAKNAEQLPVFTGSERGMCRLDGTLEALDGQNRFVVKTAGRRIVLDTPSIPFFIMHDNGEDFQLERLSWQDFPPLAEGTPLLAVGEIRSGKGVLLMSEAMKDFSFAVFYEGEGDVLREMKRMGGAEQDFSTGAGLWSVITGSLLLMTTAYLARGWHPLFFRLLFLSMAPTALLLPPGLIFLLPLYTLIRHHLSLKSRPLYLVLFPVGLLLNLFLIGLFLQSILHQLF